MRNELLRRTLRFFQWVSLTFILVLGGIMAHDALRREQTLETAQQKLEILKAGNLDDPALVRTVRELDYLYRSVYFQTQDRQAYGFLLLGIAFLVLCLLIIFDRWRFVPELQVPSASKTSREKERRELLIFTICGIGILCVILAAMHLTLPSGSASKKINQNIVGKVKSSTEKIVLAQALEEASRQWPQFRGSLLPNRNQLPENWNFTEKWKVKIPLPGFNSPVIWDDKVFVAGGNKKERAVYCYDVNNGNMRWKTACTNAPKYPELTEDTGASAPTLCVDKSRVYAIFATGEMLCCTHDGNVVWRRQLPTPDIMYGYASSPLLLGDKLIVQYDMEEKQTLYAIDVRTGEDVWSTVRQTSSSWSSPTALVKDGNIIIFTAGNLAAEGIDGNNGHVLWKNESLGGEVATGGLPHNNAFYFSNTGAFTGAFRANDGKVLFKNDNVPAPDVASPIFAANTFILFSSGGSVIGIDAENGKELYEKSFDNGFYASPVIFGDKIVAVNLDGDLFLLEPSSKDLLIKGKFSLGKKIVAIPAFSRGNIIIRNSDDELLCLESKP
jgi:outer membrane protein assembly factor BamB